MRISDWSSDVCSSDLRNCSCIERRCLKSAKGAVPYERLAGLKDIGRCLDSRRTNIQDHLIGGYFVQIDGARRRIGRELLRANALEGHVERAVRRGCEYQTPFSRAGRTRSEESGE